ncbi:DUF1822 family protein [Pseudanabaena sp. FACHB-1998]|uniref:DUF1822 family protein n=1 Tax=Pseudanabaena sp. FACHB-1998 TaxID=2692858 RepID=UPI001680355E|nr:DUF1822 family protein [Pseudanabaena sp. FACHB-1998]MBD2179334.1 DUF1822 family protein [Pseudanabaena sp. FACHB-1998]
MISEFDAIPLEAIALSPETIRQAIALSQTSTVKNQWQAYLDAIAYLSVEEWLRDRLPNYLTEITNFQCLQVHGFTIHALAITQSSCDFVEIPLEILQLPNNQSKPESWLGNSFIVIVEIQEEIEQALILGFSPYAQLVRDVAKLESDRMENTYQVPLSLFDSEPERLLLYLQHLEPVLETKTEAIAEAPQANITELILNTGLWLQEQLDDIAQNLAWSLLPAWQPSASAMRSLVMYSPEMEMQTVISELARLTVEVPPDARSAYQEFQLGDRHLRLFATVWTERNDTENPEWSILFVLGSQTVGTIPYGVRMQIRDQQQVLVDKRLEISSSDRYLYAVVTGYYDELFSVSISLPSGVMLTLPAFAFSPNAF